MKILYGTTNNAKLNAMRNATDRLGIELIGLKDLHCELPVIIEDGKTPVENAKIKAQAYYKAFGMPVFSCDSGLYFEGVMEEDQPGLFVRRVNGKELSDDEMIGHYAGLAEKYGGSLIARYYNAVHFILDDNTSFSSMDISLASESFALTTVPHPKRVEGFPLDSLSKDISTGEYYYDLETKDISTEGIVDGYYKFFLKSFESSDTDLCKEILANIVKKARENTSMFGYCGHHCDFCFFKQRCGGCRSAYNCCSMAAWSEDGVCPNVACAKEKGLENCGFCDELLQCKKGFYSTEAVAATKAKALFVKNHGEEIYVDTLRRAIESDENFAPSFDGSKSVDDAYKMLEKFMVMDEFGEGVL